MQVIVILERKVFIKSCGKCLDWVPIEGGTLCKDESITCESMGGREYYWRWVSRVTRHITLLGGEMAQFTY